MSKMKKICLVLSIIFLIPLKVFAYKTAYVEEKNISLQNIPSEIKDLGTAGSSYYPERANYYEFIDNNNNYNVIYEIKDNKTKLGWLTTDLNGEILTEKTITRYLNDFGTALYYNNYLYVLYGAIDDKTADSSSSNYASTATIEIVKYNSSGSVVSTVSIKGYDMSPNVNKNHFTANDKGYGTKIPFDAGTADMAISNGIIGINFAREMYNGHQMSFAIFADADNLEILNKSSDFSGYGLNYNHWISHSFAQRIIGTTDNEFLMADQGDGYPRALVISKTSGIQNPLTAGYKEFEIFHFREANDSEYGYNHTFANLGNIIELSDGYLVVGASEKTLSINYAPSASVNEARNIFIQKLDKNFNGKTTESIQKFNETLRKSETSRTSVANKGEFNLSSRGVTDYGVKWLTDYDDYTKSIINVRAVKINDNKIAILWAERGMKNYSAPHDNEYYFSGDYKYYYMLIDGSGNIIQNPLEIEAISLSSLINFNVKDNCIYWTQENTNGLTLYKLDTSKTDDSITFERVGAETVYITDNKETTHKFSVKTNKNIDLEWQSSNTYVATVDNEGNVTILRSGTSTITVKNKRYNVSLDYNLDVKYKVEEIELIPDSDIELVEGKTTTITYSALPYIAYDRTVDWQSSNDEIFTVNKKDATHIIVTGVSGGDAKLIGTTNDGSNVKVEINVHIIGKMTSISFEESNIYLRTGEQYNLKPIIEPKTANEPIKYYLSSYNTMGITISEDGVINAGSMGHAEYMVRGRYSGVSTYINIYSYDTVLEDHSIHFDNIGEGTTLKVTTYPYDYYPTWESSNNKVVTVDSWGRIKATGNGMAIIKVTASNGYSDTCTVIVGDYLPGDLNQNGVIDMPDVYIALKIALNHIEPTDIQTQIGDINATSSIDMADTYYILKTALNIA